MIFYNNKTQKKNLIVFIHGFKSSDKVWLDKHNEPSSLISYLFENQEINENFAYTFFSYDTSPLFNLPGFVRLIGNYFNKNIKNSQSLYDISQLLDSKIRIHCLNFENLILIGHSFGGIISKQYILNQIQKSKSTKVNLYITLATPHFGSKLANRLRWFFRNPQTFDLKFWSKTLEVLNEQWLQLPFRPKRIYIKSAKDTVTVKGAFAYEEEVNLRKLILKTHHFNITRPKSKNDDIVVELINSLSRHSIETKEAGQSNDKLKNNISEKFKKIRSDLGLTVVSKAITIQNIKHDLFHQSMNIRGSDLFQVIHVKGENLSSKTKVSYLEFKADSTHPCENEALELKAVDNLTNSDLTCEVIDQSQNNSKQLRVYLKKALHQNDKFDVNLKFTLKNTMRDKGIDFIVSHTDYAQEVDHFLLEILFQSKSPNQMRIYNLSEEVISIPKEDNGLFKYERFGKGSNRLWIYCEYEL